MGKPIEANCFTSKTPIDDHVILENKQTNLIANNFCSLLNFKKKNFKYLNLSFNSIRSDEKFNLIKLILLDLT